MDLFKSLLNLVFPWMALSGLLLAGWGLVVTPDEMHMIETQPVEVGYQEAEYQPAKAALQGDSEGRGILLGSTASISP